MKFRTEKPEMTNSDEQQLVDEIRLMAASELPGPEQARPDAYWQNLIVRTNKRIDDATSGVALSISWAARVAIPGVVAILSFLIGLHYYAPEKTGESSLTAVVLSLPAATIDTLLVDPSAVSPAMNIEDVATDPFDIPREQVADYFINTGSARELMESMTDEQAHDVLAMLGSTGQ